MSDIRYIAIDRANFPNDEAMWKDIGELVRLLVKNEYDAVVRYEDAGVYVIEYGDSAMLGYGNDTVGWASPEEWELLGDARGEKPQETDTEELED